MRNKDITLYDLVKIYSYRTIIKMEVRWINRHNGLLYQKGDILSVRSLEKQDHDWLVSLICDNVIYLYDKKRIKVERPK